MPGYNVMGSAKAVLEQATRQLALELGPKSIRINAISAGPVSTLAARGIRGFTDMLKKHAERSPCAATSPRKRSATPGSSCSPRWAAASPAR